VKNEQGAKDEAHQTLEAFSSFQKIVEQLLYLSLFLGDLHEPQQLDKLGQFVESTYPDDSDQRIEIQAL
jgi:hypothetical protein